MFSLPLRSRRNLAGFRQGTCKVQRSDVESSTSDETHGASSRAGTAQAARTLAEAETCWNRFQTRPPGTPLLHFNLETALRQIGHKHSDRNFYMKKIIALLPIMALSTAAQADTAYGALGNFDAVNDTGQTCGGFEIEIDDAHSTEIGGTYNFNHYGTPKIREDNTDPSHPKVFVTYRATVASGTTTGFTNYAPPGTISPTQGHQCTNPSVNLGCEHFGVGIYSPTYTAVKYNWLDANGQTFPAGVVHVATPVWTNYVPMVGQPAQLQPNPVVNQPPIVVQPAVVNFPASVVAKIPAPPVVVPPTKQFGDPSWVKVIKTTTHNSDQVPLENLVGDKDSNNKPLWTNGEPAEVESEWYLLQTNNGTNPNKSELAAKNPGDMGDGREVVTRRYEFYAYAASDLSIDGENGEAMCDTVNSTPGSLKGVGTVTVTDSFGNSYDFDCSAVDVVGDYQGSQMGEFNAVAPFSTISDIQSGDVGEPFPQRKVLIGGDTPYDTTTSGHLPDGLALDSTTGILSGIPAKVGSFQFNVAATDHFGSKVSRAYTLNVTGPGDVNTDFKIDLTDLNTIKSRYGQAAAANDPADVNGDLKINLLDYRKAASLCTKPRCAP